jgi:hypothetical protein
LKMIKANDAAAEHGRRDARAKRSHRAGRYSDPAVHRAGYQPAASIVIGTGWKWFLPSLRRFARACVALCLVAGAPCCLAQAQPPITLEDLHTASRSIDFVSAGQHDAYRKLMQMYAQQEAAHSDDAALALAHCQVIEAFTDDDDVEWSADAQADFKTCENNLEQRFRDNADASLYLADHRVGKRAIEFASTLLRASEHWKPAQRAQLYAVFSRAHASTNQPNLAGPEALAAVNLDPASDQLVAALRYLCDSGRRNEAESLLAKSPLPTSVWREAARVRFAADNLAPAAALGIGQADKRCMDSGPHLPARRNDREGRRCAGTRQNQAGLSNRCAIPDARGCRRGATRWPRRIGRLA